MTTVMRRFVCFILMCACFVGSCAAAEIEVRYSQYFLQYSASLTSRSGSISVNVDVRCTGYMQEIGARQIVIYEKNNGSFVRVKTYSSDNYPSLIGTGSRYNKVAITYNGTIGHEYYATVYCYAKNAAGSETKAFKTATITV